MENPVTEITSVIKGLTTSPPQHQRHVLETYFLPNGSFDHPLCHVDRLDTPITSRFLILSIYRWYKVLSPIIDIDITSIAFDDANGRLYVDCTQVFTFWFIPWRHITASLVTVLDLEKHKLLGEDTEKWYIVKQNDLYQFDEWIAFLPFIFPGARTIVRLFKGFAALACLIGATLALLIGLIKETGEGEVCADCEHMKDTISKAPYDKETRDGA